jgi:methionyl-tRNA synthetase
MVSSILPADIVARFHRLRGDDVLYVTGSDEHGTPIEVEAVRLGITPQQLTDQNHQKVVRLFESWGIRFDNYTRTENPLHKEFVQNFYLKIYENGYIFSQETELPYCPECKRYLPDRFVEGICPRCGYEQARGDQCADGCGRLLDPTDLIEPYCAICHSTPEIRQVTHWYLDLPKLAEPLREYIENNERLPENARNFSLNLLKEGLQPRPITRDTEWGIPAPFPGAEGKTIYVWVEAVLGYISATIQHFRGLDEEGWKEYWFDKDAKTLYFIGKDNIPFHTIILPALLLATEEGYNLPWNVNSTEFLLFQGQPFSKSRRVGVSIDEALELFPADYWRYTLVSIRPETKDTTFTWKIFKEKVNADLNDTLGNFIHRTLTFANKHFNSTVPKLGNLDEYDRRTLGLLTKRTKRTAEELEALNLQKALRTVISLSRLGNRYLNKKEPWKTIKTNPQAAATNLYVALQIVKSLAIALAPFIPNTAEQLWNLLNLPSTVHEQAWSKIGEPLQSGHKINKAKPLFQKIEATEQELEDMLEETRVVKTE